jgi:hypothetical protein
VDVGVCAKVMWWIHLRLFSFPKEDKKKKPLDGFLWYGSGCDAIKHSEQNNNNNNNNNNKINK